MDGVKTLPAIYRRNKPSHEQDIRSEYRAAAEKLSDGLPIPSQFLALLRTTLTKYSADNGELVVSTNSDRAYFELEGKAFTNFCAILLAVIQVHFPDRTRHDVELAVWGKDLPFRVIRLEASALRSSRWINDLGPQYICERGSKNIQILLQAMSLYAPVRDEYLYNGWDIEGQNIYIWNGTHLTGDVWDAPTSLAPCRHVLDMLDVAPHSLTIPLLSIALLSLVQSRMMAQGEYFKGVCCIVAPTQSFKSTLASLFFNFENGREADINFEATMAAIVRTVGSARDSTTIVDDFKPGATKAETSELVRKLSTIIRMCSDSSGGVQKAGPQNSTFSNMAHGLVLVTAEQIQLQVQSTLARLLILEINRKDVDVAKLTGYQGQHPLYREFIQNFISYIATFSVNSFCEHLAQQFLQERNVLRSEISEDVPADNRTSDMVTWLWIAFRKFLDYALLVGAVSQEGYDSFSREARKVFVSIMEKQAERVADLAPLRQFFRGLQVLLETKEARIGELQARNSGYSVAASKEAIGFSKKGFVYLKNGAALQVVASYYRRLGREFAVNESTLRKALADGGYILPKEKGYIHRLSVNRESYQCIKFEQAQFIALCKGGKQSGTGSDEEFQGDWALQQDAGTYLGPS